MTTPAVPSTRPDVVAYVAAVRAELDDLSPDELEELVGGLEADLGDLAAESDDDLAVRLGPAPVYAAELRSAAGLPARLVAGRARRGQLRALPGELQALGRAAAAVLDGQPWWHGVRDFLVTLRPAWWVLRGLVATVCVLGVLGVGLGLFAVVLATAAVVVSVELGRGRWSSSVVERLVVVGNVLALLLLPASAAHVLDGPPWRGESVALSGEPSGQPGLWHDGEPVENVYAYDEQGRLLGRVQLVDQRGRPLDVDQSMLTGTEDSSEPGAASVETGPVAATDVYGRPLWNVFPLRTQSRSWSDDGDGFDPAPVGPATARPAPQVSLPPLAPLEDAEGVASPSPTGAATSPPPGAATATATATGAAPATSAPRPTAPRATASPR